MVCTELGHEPSAVVRAAYDEGYRVGMTAGMEKMRERCAKAAEDYDGMGTLTNKYIAAAIRALDDD